MSEDRWINSFNLPAGINLDVIVSSAAGRG